MSQRMDADARSAGCAARKLRRALGFVPFFRAFVAVEATILALGAAVVVNRDRLRGLARSDGTAAQAEPLYASVGVASTNDVDATTPADGDAAPDAAPTSETPGTTAPPL